MEKGQIVLVANPSSGSGRGPVIRDRFKRALQQAGYTVRTVSPFDSPLDLGEGSIVVIFGGDGTVLHLLPKLRESNAIVYPVPTGNENLFASYLGNTIDPGLLLERLRDGHFFKFQLGQGECNGRSFLFVSHLSVGLDGVVLSDVVKHRRTTVTNIDYLKSVVRVLWSRITVSLTVKNQHGGLLTSGTGIIVVGNTGSYARDLNPVPESDPYRDKLVARFFPIDTIGRTICFLYHLACRKPLAVKSLRLFENDEFLIEGDGSAIPVQADGEILGLTPVRVRRAEGAIQILGTKAPPSGKMKTAA